jgi:tetrahydromethanopterin S-methyltransferase subunit E
MARFGTRSVFAAVLCTGVAMLGVAVHGMLGVDAELQRSALAAEHQKPEYRQVLFEFREWDRDCDAPRQPPRHLS